MSRPSRLFAALACVAGTAASASATWSIVLIDTRTGEVALGSATCLTNFDLQAGTPVLIPGIGGATAQSFVDTNGYNRVFTRDRLLEGVHPVDILDLLADFDSGHQTRQYGMGDTRGGIATFTGTGAGAWAGGVTGRVGDIVYGVQGNVLAGAPVVTECEQVIITSLQGGLDIPETLMLAMDQARLLGGDGRCSCDNGGADQCGSPPEGWDPDTGKCSHIAYMLIARAGDGFACNSVYPVGRTTGGVASGDVDNDGVTDLVVAARNDSRIGVLRNNDLHPEYVTFEPPQVVFVPNSPNGVELVDVDGDTDLDLVYAEVAQGTIGVCYNNGEGAFSFPGLYNIGEGSAWIAIADFNSDESPDIATAEGDTGNITILLNDGEGRFTEATSFFASTAPDRIIAAEIDGSPGVDLAVLDPNELMLRVFVGDVDIGYTQWASIEVGNAALDIEAADFDGDGRTDLAIAERIGQRVSVHRQTSPGEFESASLAEGATYTALDSADLNGDALPDIVAVSDGPRRITLLLAQPGDDPVVEGEYVTTTASNDLVLADFNNDGFLDAAHNMRQGNGTIVVNGRDPSEGQGYFQSGDGCAASDYFMELNVAFQARDNPDPVMQLQDLYDTWRVDLIGIADAIRSDATLGVDRLPVGSTTSVSVVPRDWTETDLGQGLDVFARHRDGSARLTRLGPTVDQGDGTYTIEISAADLPPESRGQDAIDFVVRHDAREVILMPRLSLTVTRPIADWNMDGAVDRADLDAFVSDWIAAAPDTDLTNDSVIDSRDLIEFVRIWAGN